MPITQVLLTATASAAPPPPPPPPPTPDGQYFAENSVVNWGSVGVGSNKPTYNTNYAFPDTVTVGNVWEFNGTNQYMITQNHTGYTQLYTNIWIYPIGTGCILMTVQNTSNENISYHYAAIEINANQTITGSFWNGGNLTSVTSPNTVTLNAWNHIYFRQNSNQILLEVNGGTAVTVSNVWSAPGDMYIGFGTYSTTNTGNSSRFYGYLAEFRMNSTLTASNYTDTRSRYEAPQPFIYDDFTVEWWQKAESNGQNSRPWSIGLLDDPAGVSVSLSYQGSDFFWINSSYPAQSGDRPVKNHYGVGWEHMAIVRKDNVIKLFSNGTSYLTWSGGNQAITALNRALVVGSGELSAGNFQGYIKDLHIIKGYAKYNANFSVPTAPIQPQTGSVFLLPAMGPGEAFDDTVGNKFGSYTNTPTWSSENPYGGWPSQTFTAFAYGPNRIALTAPLSAEPKIGLLVSDTQGWSDWVIDIPFPNHLDFATSVPVRAPGEVYTIQEVALTGTAGTHGGAGQISFDQGFYSKKLAGVEAGWLVSADGGTTTLGLVNSVTESPAPSVQIMVNFNPLPYLVDNMATWTFTPPVVGGSIRFDTGDRISYGSSVDWAFDVDGIEGSFLNMDLDANNYYSYNASNSSIWYDLTGNVANVTLYNTPYWDNGPPGNFNFNGVNQYAVGSTASMLPQSGYTKMVWFRLNTINADNNIVSSNLGGHFMFFSGTNRLWAGHSNVPPYQGAGAFGSTSTFTVDTWYFAAVTFSVANGIKLYINGVLDASDPTFQTPHNGNGSVNLGCFAPAGNLLNGKIGRVLCYGTELTAGQVLQNFNATRNRYGI